MLVIMDDADISQGNSGREIDEDESDYYGTIIEHLSPTFPQIEPKTQENNYSDSELLKVTSDSKDNTSILRKISKEIAFEFKGQTNDKSENDSFVN